MRNLYPITLSLDGRKVVIVGGGKVAERKALGLLGTGANIVLISPEATNPLKKLAQEGQIQWFPKAFMEEDLDGAFLIFAATNHPTINQFIKKAAANQLVSIADHPEGSDFHVPAKVQRGMLNITVSTSGASPLLAKKISEQLEKEFDEKYEDYLEFLHWARKEILNEVEDPSVKKYLLARIVSEEFLNSGDRRADFLKIYCN